MKFPPVSPVFQTATDCDPLVALKMLNVTLGSKNVAFMLSEMSLLKYIWTL